MRAAFLSASAVIPYLIESFGAGTFHISSFLALLAVALVASFWYAWIRPSIPVDLLFLAFMAAVYLSKLFDQIYLHPAPHVALDILGRLMWIRLGLMAVLSLRSMEDARFGFVPTSREWGIGVRHVPVFPSRRRGHRLSAALRAFQAAYAGMVEIRSARYRDVPRVLVGRGAG